MAPHCTFPYRLHAILEQIYDADVDSEASILSWSHAGRSFRIHDLEAFEKNVLPKYFPCQSKYNSFRRQLQYYGFVNHGRDNHFSHPFFLQNRKELLSQVKHKKSKLTEKKSRKSGDSSPQCNDDYLLLPDSPTRDTARESLTRIINCAPLLDVDHRTARAPTSTTRRTRTPSHQEAPSSCIFAPVDLLALHVIANAERRIASRMVLSSPPIPDCATSGLLNPAASIQASMASRRQLALFNLALLSAPFSIERPGHHGSKFN